MNITSKTRRRSAYLWIVAIALLPLPAPPGLKAQDKEIAKKLQGFDAYMTKTLKDWNAPGVGVGIVAGDKLVFAKGYGYRDYEKQLPFTPTTLCQIAPRTHLSGTRRVPPRRGLLGRIKFREPGEPIRQTFLYNNLMYAAAGYLIELESGKTWEEFVREKIFTPLNMTSTVYSIADMLKLPDYGVPYTEKRDTFDLSKLPYYEDIAGVAPSGPIIS